MHVACSYMTSAAGLHSHQLASQMYSNASEASKRAQSSEKSQVAELLDKAP